MRILLVFLLLMSSIANASRRNNDSTVNDNVQVDPNKRSENVTAISNGYVSALAGYMIPTGPNASSVGSRFGYGGSLGLILDQKISLGGYLLTSRKEQEQKFQIIANSAPTIRTRTLKFDTTFYGLEGGYFVVSGFNVGLRAGVVSSYILVDLGNNNGGATTMVTQFSVAPRVSYELLFSKHFGIVIDLSYFHIFPTTINEKIRFENNDYNISAKISEAGFFCTMAGFKIYL